MKKGILTLVAFVCALCSALCLAACGNGSKKVESITLNEPTLELEVGDTETLTATVKPNDATEKTVTWTSSVPTVATVDKAGKVTAVAEGATTVTATADGKKAECVVTVSAAKMSEQEWQASLTAFATAKNFHLTLTVANSIVGEVKLNEDTYYDNGGVERIYQKDGTDYYLYENDGVNTPWRKTNVSSTEYDNVVNEKAVNLVVGGATALGAHYSDFSYSSGKYTAAAITVNEEFKLKNIEITVAGGAVTKIVCTQVGTPDRLVTIDHIGDTEIPIPQISVQASNCPIKNGQVIPVIVGTPASELYKLYPDLETKEGKWEFYIKIPGAPGADKDGFIKPGDNDPIPYASRFDCMLVWTGADKYENVTFIIDAYDPKPAQ